MKRAVRRLLAMLLASLLLPAAFAEEAVALNTSAEALVEELEAFDLPGAETLAPEEACEEAEIPAQAAPGAAPEVALEEADPGFGDDAEEAEPLPEGEPFAALAQGVCLNWDEVVVGAGESALVPATAPEGVSLRFVTDDARVAEVDALTGEVTGRRAGDTRIIVTGSDGSEAICLVTVLKAPAKVTLSPAKAAMGVDETLDLAAELPKGTASVLTFKSSNPSVARVDAFGRVTALTAGKATITVSTFNRRKATCKVTVKAAPTSIQLNFDSVTMGVAQEADLDARVSVGSVTYRSSDEGVARIENGAVRAVGPGSAVITATTYNGVAIEAAVEVLPAPSTLALNAGAITLGVKDTFALEPDFEPGTFASMTYLSANPKVAEVSGKGVVTAKKTGRTVVTVMTHNGLTAEVAVTVVKAPSKLTLSQKAAKAYVGDAFTLTATLPEGCVSDITWTTSNPSVATVDAEGRVTVVGQGKATITASTYNRKKAACKLTVGENPNLPSQVKNVRAVLGADGALSVTWDPVAGAEDYVIYLTDHAGVVTPLSVGDAGAVGCAVPPERAQGVASVTVAAKGPQTVYGDEGPASLRAEVSKKADAPALSVTFARQKLGGASRGAVDALATGLLKLPATVGAGERFTLQVKGNYGWSLRLLDGGDWLTLPATTSFAGGKATRKLTFTVAAVPNGDTYAATLAFDIGTRRELVTVTLFRPCEPESVSLDCPATILMKKGDTRRLSAAVLPERADDQLTWKSGSARVASVSDAGEVTALKPGTCVLTAQTVNGLTASVKVTVIDTADLSAGNFRKVQAALAEDEALMGEDGGGVIWEMIRAQLVKSNVRANQIDSLMSSVKDAPELYRDLYVYSFGRYKILGEVLVDEDGELVETSYYSSATNALYLDRLRTGDDIYGYTLFHETGHAIDANASARRVYTSSNDEARAALNGDVRNVLASRIGQAASDINVALDAIDADKVVDAFMDYRELLHHDEVFDNLNEDEQWVYYALKDNLESEMEQTLDKNAATMVWDAIEGATNFGIRPSYGHSYLFDLDGYKDWVSNYYYDESGKAEITSEPWSEFFSANLLRDERAIANNLSYLPRTCAYFAETLAPKLLNYFKGLVAG